MRSRILFRMPILLLLFSLLFVYHNDANAVPSFARQTGWDCTQCHMSWLELTNVGRRFKLGGYQEMKDMKESEEANRPLVSFNFNDPPPVIPLAMWLQVSRTSTQDVSQQGYSSITGSAADSAQVPKQYNGQTLFQAGSLFLNGKLADGIGCFCQYTYDGITHQASQDNTEIRFVPEEEYKTENLKILYGMSVNNNPGMSDIYNTTGVWGWPYLSSSVAITPNAAPILGMNPSFSPANNLGHSVVGVTFYSLINRMFYVEAGAYTNARSVLHAFTINNSTTNLDGLAPYYRLAFQKDWQNGVQSVEIGTYGFRPRIYPTPGGGSQLSGGPSDVYDDKGIDAQYQYITDKHRFSFMFNYLHEDQTLNGSFIQQNSSNLRNNLSAINTKVSYYYEKWYGISVGFNRVSGSSDSGLYQNATDAVSNNGSVVIGSLNNSPNSQAMIYELNWLFAWDNAEDRRRNRLILQYTDYSKFNGASTNYNGFGRNARDNNTIYLGWWSLY